MRRGLTQQRRDGVVAADRLVADDAEPDVLGDRGERPEQDRLADAPQPGEHQVLRAALGDQPAQADLGALDQQVATDEGRRRRPGARGVRVGHRVVLFNRHAATLTSLDKVSQSRRLDPSGLSKSVTRPNSCTDVGRVPSVRSVRKSVVRSWTGRAPRTLTDEPSAGG